MKITCQSCAAKYTIADEKVAGKTVKIRCKKCGATIVVNGNEAGFQSASDAAAAFGPAAGAADAPPEEEGGGGDGQTTVFSGDQGAAAPAGGDWTVNVADDDQRTMSSAQIAEAYAAGLVTNDTYVWRDGMADWSPLSGVPELVSMVSSAAPRPAAGAPAAAPAPAPAPEPAAAAAPAAARRVVTREAADPFQAREQAVAAATPPPKLDRNVGERNENSMLFSISALTAAKDARDKDRGSAGKPAGKSGVDDILNLGGGIAAPPILAAPPVLAPVVEAPPPPPQPMASPGMGMAGAMPGAQAMPGMGMMDDPYGQKKKSNTGLIVGIVAGLAVVGGVIAFFATRPSETDPGATAQSSAVTASAAPTAPTAAPTPTQVAAVDTAAASPSGTPSDPAGANTKTSSGGTTPTGPGPTGANTGKTPDPKATASSAPTAAPTATQTAAPTATAPPAAEGAEFNRAAAMSALSAAAGAAKGCKKPDGPTGSGKVKVTFAPSGNVTSAQVEGPPFAGTPVGGCVASAFRGARVPPFSGAPVSVSKSFSIN